MFKNYLTYIIEPNRRLATPYMYLPDSYRIMTFPSVQLALRQMKVKAPDLVFLSTSLSYAKSLTILEELKNLSLHKIIPVVFVVDWSERLPKLPGTHWGYSVGLLHSLSSDDEVRATLDRVMQF